MAATVISILDEEPSEDSEPVFGEHSQGILLSDFNFQSLVGVTVALLVAERALQRVKELMKKLEMAKANYHQLGGLLEEDKREMQEDTESAK